jgi:esterase/lipase
MAQLHPSDGAGVLQGFAVPAWCWRAAYCKMPAAPPITTRIPMKKILFLALPALLALLFALGPRPQVATPAAASALPADLDAYLAASEGRYSDITPGAEKHIRWAHADRRQTDLAIVYLHGFSATRQETAPLAEQLAERLQANVFHTRLHGHGRPGPALAEAQAGDWLADSREALAIGQRLGRQVLIIGTSTGATLASWLALDQPEAPVLAYVLISPNFAPKDPAASVLTWPWAEHFVPLLLGAEHQWQPRNEAQARYWSHRYPVQALLPMMALVKHVRAQPLEQIQVPLLVLYSPEDQVVSAPAIEAAFARFGSPQKKLLALADTQDPSHHVLAGDILSPRDTPRVQAAILDFIAALPESAPRDMAHR